nr:hypothetical protein [Mangrovicoccus sp. HB161399]
MACGQAAAQSSVVRPGELGLTVTVENSGQTPFVREMVLIRIRGMYRRHITLEKLEQPDLDGFSWAQLGPDSWTRGVVAGRPVKIFERRMALYPTRPGRLDIGPFVHHLTLTDEDNGWFAHDVRSEPVAIEVDPAPADAGWWFPVLSLQISDNWSNPATQLEEGQGVLRVIRVDALGAMPDMIPPMPELSSPSALIFPHPEKRLVEQTPFGPLTRAFWRWTIRPTNGTSAIVEPLRVPFYDTRNRVARVAEISAQRIAYADRAIPEPEPAAVADLPGLAAGLAAAAAFLGGLAVAARGRRFELRTRLARVRALDPLAWRMRRAARQGDAAGVRRAAAAMLRRDAAQSPPRKLGDLAAIDRHIFGPEGAGTDLKSLADAFLRRR